MTAELQVTLAQDDEGYVANIDSGIQYRLDDAFAIEVAQEQNTRFDDTIPNEAVLRLLLGDL